MYMVKPPPCEKLQMEECKGTENEDAKRLPYLSTHGIGNYRSMPKKAGLRRSCGKNCRIRWNNQRTTDLVQIESSFSPEEEELIIKLHATIGSRWTIIAQQLPGRTDNEVKNFWNKKLKKKLTAIGIDPITHRPFSQILADYGNIGGCPKARNHFGVKRDIRNEVMLKSEPPFSPQSSSDFNSHFDARFSLPETESSKDHFLSNSNNLAHDNGNSLDLLSQLQAITMVTDSLTNNSTPGISARIPTECISSSASSSPLDQSPSSATNKAIASSSFSWCDFLLEDAFLPTNGQEQENGVKFWLSDANKKEQQTAAAAENENPTSKKITEDYSVSNGSFVEAMLERETEMLASFHGLLEEPFYY